MQEHGYLFDVSRCSNFVMMKPSRIKRLAKEILQRREKAPRVLCLQRNPVGRDFVFGDLHGAFPLLEKKLVTAGYRRGRDRVIGVGDLIDRGARSAQAAEFLAGQGAYSVMGNHEHNLLDLYTRTDFEHPEHLVSLAARSNFNGLGWVLGSSVDEREAVLLALAGLPLAIEVETADGVVGIIHAEVPVGMSWGKFVMALRNSSGPVRASCLFGRRRLSTGVRKAVAGVSHIYCGHTIQRAGSVTRGNVSFLDTGAVFVGSTLGAVHYPCADLVLEQIQAGVLQEKREALASAA